MKFTPLNDRILVKRSDSEQTTKSGIIIPDNAQEKPMQGVVKAVGPGKSTDDGSLRALLVQEGHTVLFRKYAGTDVTIEGEEHLIMREDEILAIVEE
jgi:chaperonin GroES